MINGDLGTFLAVLPALICCIFFFPISLYYRQSTATPDYDFFNDSLQCALAQSIALSVYFFIFLPHFMRNTRLGDYYAKFCVRNQELHILPFEGNDK